MGKVSKTKRRKRLKRLLIILITIILVLVIACVAYISKYYHAEISVDDYRAPIGTNLDGLEVTDVYEMGTDIGERNMVDGLWVVGPETNNENLVIFYPGAKVEYTAYLPLCYELANNGVDCYIVKMPGNLAFFGMNKAEDIMKTYNHYDNYYLAGHSLGGAMGASYVSENIDAFDGMIFLAAYPTKSLSTEDFSVLSIYGSEDLVLNMEKIQEGRQFMPADYTEICIQGGNHAQFGNYGVQEGDGAASITTEEQQKQTVEAILEMLK